MLNHSRWQAPRWLEHCCGWGIGWHLPRGGRCCRPNECSCSTCRLLILPSQPARPPPCKRHSPLPACRRWRCRPRRARRTGGARCGPSWTTTTTATPSSAPRLPLGVRRTLASSDVFRRLLAAPPCPPSLNSLPRLLLCLYCSFRSTTLILVHSMGRCPAVIACHTQHSLELIGGCAAAPAAPGSAQCH